MATQITFQVTDYSSTHTVHGIQLDDGRVLVPGSGVDGADGLWASAAEFSPCGGDRCVGFRVGEACQNPTSEEVILGALGNEDRALATTFYRYRSTADEVFNSVEEAVGGGDCELCPVHPVGTDLAAADYLGLAATADEACAVVAANLDLDEDQLLVTRDDDGWWFVYAAPR